MKKKLRKNVISAVAICIVVLGGLFNFVKNFYIPIPFDQKYMSIEIYKAALITYEPGYVVWEDVDYLDDLIPEDNDQVMDAVRLVYEGINDISGDVIGRTINRNGENVKILYYCYRETLWDIWFADPDLKRGAEYRNIYGDNYLRPDYKPQRMEIYYLPVKNLEKFKSLSDEEYNGLKEKSTLIWSGMA